MDPGFRWAVLFSGSMVLASGTAFTERDARASAQTRAEESAPLVPAECFLYRLRYTTKDPAEVPSAQAIYRAEWDTQTRSWLERSITP